MKRLRLAALAALALAGCVVVPVATDDSRPLPPPPPPPPPPRVVVTPPPEPTPVIWYHGPHFIPEDEGGGWCYEEGAHTHPYFPDRPDVYVVERGYYTYDGPAVFVYVGGHPLPGGGWCFLAGPHDHDYFPPPRAGFVWHHHHGFFYEGPYRPARPPPPAFWPRPFHWARVPPPRHLPSVPAPVYRPRPGAPAVPPPRVIPDRPDDRDRVRFDDRDRDRGRIEDRDRDRPIDRDRFDDRDRRKVDDRFDDRGIDRDRKLDDRPGDRDRRFDRDRLDGRDRKVDLDRDGGKPATITPPTLPPRDERKLEGVKGDPPKGAVTDAPPRKDRADTLPARRPGNEAIDRRREVVKERNDGARSNKADDAKDDAPRRRVRDRN